jgi:hypothetical protein
LLKDVQVKQYVQSIQDGEEPGVLEDVQEGQNSTRIVIKGKSLGFILKALKQSLSGFHVQE